MKHVAPRKRDVPVHGNEQLESGGRIVDCSSTFTVI